MIIAVNFQFKQLERRSLKNQGFNGIRTRDLHDSGVMLYLLSYEATHFTPHRRYELNKLTSLPMCGFIAQLVEHRTGIAGGHEFESR